MAAKTTVNLPDDLHEWAKNEPDLNVSEVLRNALGAEKAAREKLRTGDLAMALADRLNLQGGRKVEDRHAEFYREGRTLAAKRLSVDEFDDISAWYQETDFSAFDDGWAAARALANLIESYEGDPHALHADNFEHLLGGRRLSPGRVEAFVKGIIDVWNEAAPHVE